ncbi:uncharacterized protein YcfJ [Sulfitobacter undariae]|uniref:Uncharacterized protein YcfJ n=1 Tax=Sulfitobacter undariae TaxID=1563671 RepID=A0A7W6E310_9RHOB|nr:glycine zipper 2TM domain-containing protein [Sulfitobacter undariae]MBB3993354.1 uncharacterized protein YcfJ [Sulfitobacter undariae]
MKTVSVVVLFTSMVLLQACSSPQQQKQVGCVGATVAGSVAGAVLGKQLGGGHGKEILTTAGAVAGGMAGNKAAGC